MQIPEKFVTRDLSETRMILKKRCEGEKLSKREISDLVSKICEESKTCETINEMLKIQIIDLLRLGFNLSIEEACITFDLKSAVFVSDDITMSIEENFWTKTISLLECYEGKRAFYVHTSFVNGNANISIQA